MNLKWVYAAGEAGAAVTVGLIGFSAVAEGLSAANTALNVASLVGGLMGAVALFQVVRMRVRAYVS